MWTAPFTWPFKGVATAPSGVGHTCEVRTGLRARERDGPHSKELKGPVQGKARSEAEGKDLGLQGLWGEDSPKWEEQT